MDALSSLSDIGKVEFNLSQIELFRFDHGRQTLTTLVNQHIIDSMHSSMKSANYSQKIIERTFLDRIEFLGNGDAQIHIKSDYSSESGFDVSEAREKGTKRHKIEPKGGTSPAGPPFALSFFINGKRVFSKGHYVSGIIASHIIENTIQSNESTVRSEFQRIEQQWINDTLAK